HDGRPASPTRRVIFPQFAVESKVSAAHLQGAARLSGARVASLQGAQITGEEGGIVQRGYTCAATPAASPRSVKRAVDYIHAHLDQRITVALLVAVVGVPGRTLFQNFHAFKGVSPIRYVRDRRFERARGALFTAGVGDTVTAVARRWG